VVDAVTVRHVEQLAKEKFPAPSIIVIWDGVRTDGAPQLGARAPEDQMHRWIIAIAAAEYRTPTGVMSRSGRGLEEIYEGLMDADAGLRTRAVAMIADESVYLVHESATLEIPPERGPEGGRAFLVTRWKTTEVLG
jgi:hypothetical protein